MSDSNAAEQLDPSTLGEEVGDDARAADEGFPPDEPMAVDDPNITADGSIARDDVESRQRRRDVGSPAEPAAPGLVETGTDPDRRDDEPQLLADDAASETAPEADAVHVERDT